MLYRAYNLVGEERQIDFDTVLILPLGSKGKGLKLSMVILGKNFQNGEVVRLRKVTVSGLPEVDEADGEPKGWLAHIRATGKPQPKAYGTVNIPVTASKNAVVVDYGIGSYGEGLGMWIDTLVAVPFKTVVMVDRTGMTPLFLAFGESDVKAFTKITSLESFLESHAGYTCGALVKEKGWDKTWKRVHLIA